MAYREMHIEDTLILQELEDLCYHHNWGYLYAVDNNEYVDGQQDADEIHALFRIAVERGLGNEASYILQKYNPESELNN